MATILTKCGKEMDKRGYNIHKRFCTTCKGESTQPSPEKTGDTKTATVEQTPLQKTQKFIEERTSPEKVVDVLQKHEQKTENTAIKQETVSSSQHNDTNKNGGSVWGWLAAGVGSLIVIGIGIALGGKRNV